MKQLHPKAVWFFFVSFVMRAVIPILFLSVYLYGLVSSRSAGQDGELADVIEFSFADFFDWLWIIIPVFLIVCFVWARLSYRFYRYELADVGFRKERGVIYKKYVTIPYDRIQNVDIYRGVLARVLGPSDLNIQTAGISGTVGVSEGRLPGLSREDAEQLRDELVERARGATRQGL